MFRVVQNSYRSASQINNQRTIHRMPVCMEETERGNGCKRQKYAQNYRQVRHIKTKKCSNDKRKRHTHRTNGALREQRTKIEFKFKILINDNKINTNVVQHLDVGKVETAKMFTFVTNIVPWSL